ncbi:MAG TPA: phosphate-starvation-inducible PsiE family protein [Terriglobales bacterium]|nr:phosphate-starvation-inducible PsiE family protein [Terriglobales bacterium]
MNETKKDASHPVRQAVVQILSSVEDLVYVGLGLLLTSAALTLLVIALKSMVLALWHHALGEQIVNLLDQILLILLVIELLYTVQVSFRERGLIAEPFLVVALIAVIRRILVITAEVPKLPEAGDVVFRHAMLELGVLTVMVLVLVGSLIMMQKYAKRAV